MKYRTALLGLTASALLLGTAGVAQAHHRPDQDNYSPCRPVDPDETRLGYTDGEQDDPRRNLPTIYVKGDQGSMTGHVGICGGGGGDEPEVKFVEVGNDNQDGKYLRHSDPPSAPAEAISPAPELGSVTVGDDHVEVDGTEGNPPSQDVHPWLDGYVSAGLTDDDGEPGVCMSGDNNRAYYQANPSARDCNEALLAAAVAPSEG